jgi:hypothetical protein
MARPRSALTKFVLSLPHSLSVKEVIAQARTKGMKASENNVYRIRRTFGAKAATGKPANSTPKPAAAPPSRSNPPSKSDFIREQPATLSAAEVVAKAKAAGIKLDSFLVYKVRSRAGAKAKKKGPAKKTSTVATIATPKRRLKKKASVVRSKKASNGATPLAASAAPSSSAEELLRAVAAELGLGRAVEILQGERARVRAAIGG